MTSIYKKSTILGGPICSRYIFLLACILSILYHCMHEIYSFQMRLLNLLIYLPVPAVANSNMFYISFYHEKLVYASQ